MDAMIAAFARNTARIDLAPSEDAYYLRHRPGDRRLPRSLSAIAALGLLVVAAFGLPWPV